MNRAKAKKELLSALADLLDKDDDLFPDDLEDGSLSYRCFDAARSELSEEFRRRAKEASSRR